MIEVTTPAQLIYDERGLIPCVVQQYDTGEVLMVAWMNEESVGLRLNAAPRGFGAAAARSFGIRARPAEICSKCANCGPIAIAIRCS